MRELVGKRFGRLLVIKHDKTTKVSGKNRDFFVCKCDCGAVKIVRSDRLGTTTNSCGCLQREITSKMSKTHGMSRTRLYQTWRDMRDRCENSHNSAYINYGGRGIKVCEEWHVFEAFKKWAMENGYNDKLTIDRKNNNGNYGPDNCQWITIQEQQRNKRENNYYKFIEHNGQRKTLKAWSLMLGDNEQLVSTRLRQGWDIVRAITEPVNTQYRHREATIS